MRSALITNDEAIFVEFSNCYSGSIVIVSGNRAVACVFALDDFVSSTTLRVDPDLVLLHPAHPPRAGLQLFDGADQAASIHNCGGRFHAEANQSFGHMRQIADEQERGADGDYPAGHFGPEEMVD